MEQIEIREGARRQHRSLAMFCALYCWHHDKKAVFVYKELFLSYLGLSRLRGTRYDWIVEDTTSYFPHVFKRESKEISLIVFSKLSEEELLKNKSQAIYLNPKALGLSGYNLFDLDEENEKAIKFMNEAIPYLSEIRNLHEFSITSSLSLLANGIVSPSTILAKKV